MRKILATSLATSLAAGALLLAGCGSSAGGTAANDDGASAQVRTVRAILPLDLEGGDIRDWKTAMQLAVDRLGGPIGGIAVRAAFANDSKPNGEESPDRALAAAREAVADPGTLAVLGPVSSSSAALAAPVLNRARMLEVLMSATAVSLTVRLDGASGPPADVAPTGKRTIVRIVPNDRVQARALLEYLHEEGVTRAEVVDDGGRFGTGLATDLVAYAPGSGVSVRRWGATDRDRVGALARSIAIQNRERRGRWSLLMAVNDQAMAVRGGRAAAAVDEDVAISGPDALTFRGFLSGMGQLEENAYVTTFELPLAYYGPRGDRIFNLLKERLGRPPAAGSLFAYEAMALAIASIRTANAKTPLAKLPLTAQRQAVTAAGLGTTYRGSVIGTYSIGLTGDTSNALFGAYRVKNAALAKGRAIDTTGRW